MKSRNLLFVLFLINSLYSNAQRYDRYSSENPFRLSIGFLAIDDSFSSENQLFNFKDNWNFSRLPTRISGEYVFTKNISAEVSFSHVKYDPGKLVDGEFTKDNITFTAIDLNAKYDLNGVLDLIVDVPYNFDPYLITGIGMVSIKDYERLSGNFGGGAHFWFWHESDYDFGLRQLYKRLGLFAQVQGRYDINAIPGGRQIQYSAGVICRF